MNAMNVSDHPQVKSIIVHPNATVIGGAFSVIKFISPVEIDKWSNLRRFGDWSPEFARVSMQVSGTMPSEKHWYYIIRIQDITLAFFKKQNKIPKYSDIYAALGDATREIDQIFSNGMDEACRAAGIPTLSKERIFLKEGDIEQ